MLYSSQILDQAKKEINSLSPDKRGRIRASMETLCRGDFLSVYIKALKGKIKELVVADCRIIFFIHDQTVYFIHVFIKKTKKTPKAKIEHAEKLYKIIINYEKN